MSSSERGACARVRFNFYVLLTFDSEYAKMKARFI
jgi:hypothetical protein